MVPVLFTIGAYASLVDAVESMVRVLLVARLTTDSAPVPDAPILPAIVTSPPLTETAVLLTAPELFKIFAVIVPALNTILEEAF